MTAKEYLGQLRKLNVRISIVREDIMRLRARAESMTVTLSEKVQSSPRDTFSDNMAKLVDREAQLESLCDVYDTMVAHILDEILQMPNELYSSILYKRYASGLSLDEIAKILHYSHDRVRHLHGEALAAFERQFPNVKEL
jgi:DNA-directed RNA polymerase specialized sigma subunit